MNALSLRTKLRHSINVLWYVLWYKTYFPIVIVLTYLIASFVVWSLNFGLIRYILFEEPQLSVWGKLAFFHSGVAGVFTSFNNLQTIGIQLFSVLFAINVVLLVFVLRQRNVKKSIEKSGGAAFVFALLSTGCVACGTSVLAPVFITLGITSAAAVREISTLFSVVASALLLYSIYKYTVAIQINRT